MLLSGGLIVYEASFWIFRGHFCTGIGFCLLLRLWFRGHFCTGIGPCLLLRLWFHLHYSIREDVEKNKPKFCRFQEMIFNCTGNKTLHFVYNNLTQPIFFAQ